MTIQLDTLHNLDPRELMREVNAQLMSTHGLLGALALSEDERREQLDGPGGAFTGPLDAGHVEAGVHYLAEEVLLATRLSQRLLDTTPERSGDPIDTTDLSLVEMRRVVCLTSETSRLDVGEALGALLSGVTGITRWLTSNAEYIDPLNPVVPALIVITHRLETIGALTSAWISATMARPATHRAA